MVGNHLRGGLSADEGVVKVRILGRRVVAPDDRVRHLADMNAGLAGELGLGPILVEAGHREPALFRHLGGRVHGDETVGIAGIADDEGAHVRSGVLRDSLTLSGENLAVDAEEILALHSRLARHTANEQGPVHVVKTDIEVGGRPDLGQKRKGTVVELHDDALERLHARLDLDQAQRHFLLRTEHRAAGDAKEKGITDLAGGAGHCNSYGLTHGGWK